MPERLEEIVTKCLAKEKDERYQTAKDLLIDLRNLRRKLDVDAEIERTVAPAFRTTGAGESPSTQGAISANVAASETAANRTSSAEYLVTGIRQHKLGLAIVAFVLIAAGIGAFLVFRNRVGPFSFTAATGVRLPYGTPILSITYKTSPFRRTSRNVH